MASYFSFVAIALILAIAPGSDTATVLKNSLMHGRKGGFATCLGVTAAAAVQAGLTAAGLGLIVAQSQPVLQALRWLGAAYLMWMACQALWSAWKGDYAPIAGAPSVMGKGFRQGFIVNITNPAVLLFYISIFPQFMTESMPLWTLCILAVTYPVIGLGVLGLVVLAVHSVGRWLQRRPVRRVMDLATGVMLGGISLGVARNALTEAS